MSLDGAAEFLDGQLPSTHPLGGDRVGLRTIAASAVRMPTALLDLARRIRATPDWTVDDHLVAMRDPGREVDRWNEGLRGVLAGLDEAHASRFALLAVGRGADLPVGAVAALWDTTTMRARVALESLAANLLSERRADRWRVPREVAPFARWLLSREVRPSLALRAATRLMTYYADVGESRRAGMQGGGDVHRESNYPDTCTMCGRVLPSESWRGSDAGVGALAGAQLLGVLSVRERDVAELVSGGFTNREIARRLGISARTVEDHVARICRKLDLPSRAAIGRRIAELGRG